MFDFTPEIILHSKLQKKYNAFRIALHVIFLFAMLFVLYRILFPIVPLDFDFSTPNALKNSIANVRQDNQPIAQGLIESGEPLLFNANPIGQFSSVDVTFALEKNAPAIENTSVKLQKSYRAFFYPTGQPIGFKDATLLSTPGANYYMISDGLLRKFANTNVILELGYPKSAFVEVADEDLSANKRGEDISNTENYPNGTLFAIDNNYYQLKDQKLFQFISVRAFLSQFDPISVIAKNADFLSRYPMAETYLGFADGTLVSSAESVFVLSEEKSYPIENEITFAAMGFSWDNVIAATSDELGAYKKQKQFVHNSPHPNGTIFKDKKDGTHFIIKDGKKYPIANDAAMQTYLKQNSILADSQEVEKEASCALKKHVFNSSIYSCSIPLENFAAFIGNDYQVTTVFPVDVTAKTINTTFSTPLTFHSFMNSLSIIKAKLKNR